MRPTCRYWSVYGWQSQPNKNEFIIGAPSTQDDQILILDLDSFSDTNSRSLWLGEFMDMLHFRHHVMFPYEHSSHYAECWDLNTITCGIDVPCGFCIVSNAMWTQSNRISVSHIDAGAH